MANSSVLGPLNLNNTIINNPKIIKNINCLICDKTWLFPDLKDEYLVHLYLQHRIIIGDVEKVAILDDYLSYWTRRFEGNILCITLI